MRGRPFDLKELYQEEADNIALEEYGKEDFYDLEEDTQLEVYNRAMMIVNERLVAAAEAMHQMEGR